MVTRRGADRALGGAGLLGLPTWPRRERAFGAWAGQEAYPTMLAALYGPCLWLSPWL